MSAYEDMKKQIAADAQKKEASAPLIAEKNDKARRQRMVGAYDEESGKFFDQMRQGFRQRTQSLASNQLTGGLNQLNQASARAGTSFSGINQAAQGNLYGQIGAAQVEAQSGYDQKLSELRETQRDAFLQGQFDYFNELSKMQAKMNMDKEFARFQAELADKYTSGWGQFFSAVGSGIGLFASGGLSGIGKLFSGGTGGQAQNYRMGGEY